MIDILHTLLVSIVSRDTTNDMTVRQLCVLSGLARGPRTIRDIAAETHIGKPSISRAGDKLEAMGFAQRRDDPDDRRSVLLALTPAGKRFLQTLTVQT